MLVKGPVWDKSSEASATFNSVTMVTACSPILENSFPTVINILMDRLSADPRAHTRTNACWGRVIRGRRRAFVCMCGTSCQNRLGCCRSAWQLKHFIIRQARPQFGGVVQKHPHEIFSQQAEKGAREVSPNMPDEIYNHLPFPHKTQNTENRKNKQEYWC